MEESQTVEPRRESSRSHVLFSTDVSVFRCFLDEFMECLNEATESVSWRSSPHSFSFKWSVEAFVFIVINFFFNLSLHSRWPALFCDVFFQHCTWTPRSRVVVHFCSDVAATLWSLQSRAQLGKKSFSILACKLFCVIFSVNRFLQHLLDVTAEFCDRANHLDIVWVALICFFVFCCFRFGFVLEPSRPS